MGLVLVPRVLEVLYGDIEAIVGGDVGDGGGDLDNAYTLGDWL